MAEKEPDPEALAISRARRRLLPGMVKSIVDGISQMAPVIVEYVIPTLTPADINPQSGTGDIEARVRSEVERIRERQKAETIEARPVQKGPSPEQKKAPPAKDTDVEELARRLTAEEEEPL